ncbi:MAG: type II toxin-antitoxin system RelE/ParE family toxin [Saprospiraceae bacterium]
MQSLYSRLDDLLERPESFSLVKQRPRFRKAKLQKFPYYMVFRINETRSTVLVVAVVHVKRNPAVWIRALR